MKNLVLVAVAFLIVLSVPAVADTQLRTVSEAGITVSYPPKMEAQAKRILGMAKGSIAPSVDIHRQLVSMLSDADSVAIDITSLLGCDELKEKTKLRLLTYRDKSQALVQVFSSIRLVEAAEGISKGGVDAGVLQVRYSSDKDDFTMSLVLPIDSQERLDRSYFPVFVNADGAVRGENKIAQFAIAQLGTSKAIIVAPVHEAANFLITQDLKLYHPFTRWFSEGVSGWTARKVVTKRWPDLKSLADEMFSVSPGSKKRETDVNLLAWPQVAYQSKQRLKSDPALDAALTQFSVQLMSDVLGGNRGGELARILMDIKFKGNPDTEAISQVISKVTGVDFKSRLSKYVPDKVRTADTKRLFAQAEKLAQEKNWTEAAKRLQTLLESAPEDVNARLNLAWMLRQKSQWAESEMQVFTASALLRQKEYSFHLIVPSLEGNYVLARLAILVGNLETAQQLLEPVLKANPNHRDAKRAMQEILQIEKAVKGAGA